MDIIKPANGEVIARVMLADEEDTRRAIAAAKSAFASFGRPTKEERLKILRRLHEAVSARLDDLTSAMVRAPWNDSPARTIEQERSDHSGFVQDRASSR